MTLGALKRVLWVLLLAGACAACDTPSSTAKLQMRSGGQFLREVYPVLIRDCGFPTCHGSHERFFQVWGPGRSRLDPLTSGAFDTATGDEISLSYQLALSMIDPAHPGRSLLLRKPLAVAAGGAGHRGVDKFGRNVYRTTSDEGYLTIARWVFSEPTGLAK